MLYFSFIYPHLLYGVEVYANTSKLSLKRLMVLDNQILRVLQMQPHDAHTVQLYKKYNTLPIPELHNYQILLLVHKLLYHSINCLQLLMATLFQILQFIAIVLEVAVIYIAVPTNCCW